MDYGNQVSIVNSTNVLLPASGTFTGQAESTTGFSTIVVAVNSDTTAAAGGLQIQQSNDGVTFDTINDHFNYLNPPTVNYVAVAVTAPFFRIVFINGVVLQSVFKLQTFKMVISPFTMGRDSSGGSQPISISTVISGAPILPLQNGASGSDAFANNIFTGFWGPTSNFGGMVFLVFQNWFNGTTWDRARTPSIFKTVSVAATVVGNSAVWTPAAGKKFRLMRFQVTGQGLAATATGVVTVSFQDAAVAISQGTYDNDVPAVAGVVTGVNDISKGWVDLGNGILSSTANNVLNFNISAAGAGTVGTYRINVCGTEE
jgi:hypothetical protein